MHLTLHTDESGEFEGDLRQTPIVCGLVLPQLARDQLDRLRSRQRALMREAGAHTLHGGELGRLSTERRDALARSLVAALFETLSPRQREAEGRGEPSRPTLFVVRAEDLTGESSGFTADGFGANRFVRMLLELLRQVVAYNRFGDASMDLHLASRIFPVPAVELPHLVALGYVQQAESNRVYVGRADVIRTALQVLLGETEPRSVATISSVEVGPIRDSDDPRFVLVDQLANYLHRHRPLLEGSPRGISASLQAPGLRVDVRARGPRLDALTEAHDAYRAGDLLGAFEALMAHPQPKHHARYVSYLQRRIVEQAREVIGASPILSERLLTRAEGILDLRAFDLLADASLAAELVATHDTEPARRTRAEIALATIRNRQGDVLGASDAWSRAIASLEAAPPSLASFLQRADLTQRRAVTRMNTFQFALAEEELAPWLDRVEKAARAALGPDARERVAGEIAGTMAQAAAHRLAWERAAVLFAQATHHLGEDHVQAALRAHAAISRGDRPAAEHAAAQALGSTNGRQGYDMDLGVGRLEDAAAQLADDVAARPFDAWLLLRLAERDWIAGREALWHAAEGALATSERAHHPMMLVHLAHGRLARSIGWAEEAERVWCRGQQRFPEATTTPTVRMQRVQLGIERALLVADAGRFMDLAQEAALDLERALEAVPQARPWFAAALASVAGAATPEAGRAALRALLERFTFTFG